MLCIQGLHKTFRGVSWRGIRPVPGFSIGRRYTNLPTTTPTTGPLTTPRALRRLNPTTRISGERIAVGILLKAEEGFIRLGGRRTL